MRVTLDPGSGCRQAACVRFNNGEEEETEAVASGCMKARLCLICVRSSVSYLRTKRLHERRQVRRGETWNDPGFICTFRLWPGKNKFQFVRNKMSDRETTC